MEDIKETVEEKKEVGEEKTAEESKKQDIIEDSTKKEENKDQNEITNNINTINDLNKENKNNETKEKSGEQNVINQTISEEEQLKILSLVKEYFSGPNKNNNQIKDISYSKWMNKNINIKKLCTAYEVNYLDDNNTTSTSQKKNIFNNPFGKISNHDFECELKLLKWITEDEEHKKEFIKFEENKSSLLKANRYNNIIPYEYNITPIDPNNTNKNDIKNYINASYIKNPIKNKSNLFIATQCPLDSTISSFWKMIYNHKIKLIIMLSSSSEEELGKNIRYWPKNNKSPLNIENENLKIELLSTETIAPNAMYLTKLKINNELEVKHLHILCWPEFGLPHDEFLATVMVEKIMVHINEQLKDENSSPIVVHGSAGVGRTGTLIAICNIIICFENLLKINKPPILCVFNVVRKLREQRYSMVSDKDQYKFIYDFSIYWIKKYYLKK